MGQITEVCEVADSKSVFFGNSMGDIPEGYVHSVAMTLFKYIMGGIDSLKAFIDKVNIRGGEPFMRRGNKSLGYRYPMLYLSRGGSEEAIETILKDKRIK